MKRSGFGYRLTREAQKERANADTRRRDGDDEPVVVRKKSEPELRSREEAYNIGIGLDFDAELARRKEATIHDPKSFEMAASQRRARDVAERYNLTPDVEKLYALMLRTCDLPRKRQTMVATANRYRRVEIPIESNPAGIPDGFAPYYPANVPLEAILGLPIPGPPPMRFPLSQAPAGISPRPRAEAARLQKAHDNLEAIRFLEWIDRPSWRIQRL